MITSWDIYWITRMDSLNDFFSIFGIGALVFFLGLLSWIGPMIMDGIYNSDKKERYWSLYKKSMIWGVSVGVLFTFISLFIPTTKEVAAIYIIPKIVNNEQVQKMPDNAMKLLNAKFDQWIDEATDKKVEKK